MRLIGHNGAIYKLLDIPERGIFISGGGEGWIVQWDKAGTNPDGVLLADAKAQVFSLAILPLTDLLIIGCMNGELIWVNMGSKTIVKKYQLNKYAIYDILVVNDLLYTLSADGYITSWDPLRMVPLVSKCLSSKALRSIIYNPDQESLIVGASDGCIYYLDKNLEESSIFKVEAHQSSVFTLAYSNGILYSGGRDAKIKIWDTKIHKQLNTLDAHWFTVNDLILVEGGKKLISCSRDKKVRVWDTETLLPIPFKWDENHVNSVNSVLFDPITKSIISGSDDRSIIFNPIS